MLGALLASVIVAPAPSPSPLKTIIHVRSSAFCTTLRQNVGGAVRSLIQNNIAIDETKTLFLKIARDEVSSANTTMVIDMDMHYLGPMIDEIVRNRAAAQTLLLDAHQFPAQPRSEDERRLAQMRQQLQAIVDHQNQALNILSGSYYSYNGNRLMGYGDGLKAPVDSPNETPIVMPPISANGVINTSTSPIPAATPASVDLGLLGMTKFAALFNGLTTYQLNEEALEAKAAATILQSSAECNVGG